MFVFPECSGNVMFLVTGTFCECLFGCPMVFLEIFIFKFCKFWFMECSPYVCNLRTFGEPIENIPACLYQCSLHILITYSMQEPLENCRRMFPFGCDNVSLTFPNLMGLGNHLGSILCHWVGIHPG